MNNSMLELYQQMIIEHNRKPRNYGKPAQFTHSSEGFNPLCGDHIWVFLTLAGETIQEIHFTGEGCAICKASSSLMTAAVKGQSRADAERLVEEFRGLVTGSLKPDRDEHHLGKLTVFSGIWQFPARVKCAALAWHTLHGALSNKESVSTES